MQAAETGMNAEAIWLFTLFHKREVNAGGPPEAQVGKVLAYSLNRLHLGNISYAYG